MKGLKVVVVEPKYQINLGYIARVLRNFGIDRLYLVNPRCNHKGREAIKYSKHAHSLLENAKIYKNIDKAIDRGMVIGTTGIWYKTNTAFFNVYRLGELHDIIKQNKYITLLIGRDDTGLSKDELMKCDATLFIGADRRYPVLNISHALAIILYELTKEGFGNDYAFIDSVYADKRHQESVIRLFRRLMEGNQRIRHKSSVEKAFRHLLKRAMPTKKEINAISIALAVGVKKKK